MHVACHRVGRSDSAVSSDCPFGAAPEVVVVVNNPYRMGRYWPIGRGEESLTGHRAAMPSAYPRGLRERRLQAVPCGLPVVEVARITGVVG